MMALKKRPGGLDSPVVPKVMKHVGRAHVAVYRRTGGRIGGKWRIGSALRRPVPICLLEHVGRTSGTTYTSPLLYLLDGPDVVVVASQGGLPKHPQWYRNLMAAPDARIQIGPQVREIRARTADAEERQRLWPRLVDLYADFESYQSWTEREIPVVVCSPR
ncbi:nitroreductase family deazaflavin-dependent oxidoreductase [Myroides odoratimimus subsp. xuanwuensis]